MRSSGAHWDGSGPALPTAIGSWKLPTTIWSWQGGAGEEEWRGGADEEELVRRSWRGGAGEEEEKAEEAGGDAEDAESYVKI